MFSSDQIFEVSGSMDQLEKAIKFAIDMHGIGKSGISYQITKNGKYCLGWGDDEEWKKYPFDFDVHIVSEIVKQFLEKQDCEDPYAWADGSSEKGFLMKIIPEVFSDEKDGIRKPFYGIVSIEPYMNFYAK
jgi:hypothetical protein